MSGSPARHINLAGASNFRDLGGYRATDGRTVRWRQIFRSNHLGHLTQADIEVLRPLGLRSAFDFRGAEERVAAMCGLHEIVVHSLPIEPTAVAALRTRLASGVTLSSADARALNFQFGSGAEQPPYAAASISASRSAMTSSNAEIAC
jgi:protein-tyrosine phosphatase